MNKSHKVESCQSGADFVRAALQSPALKSARWSGDHCVVTGPLGHETLVNSKYEYPPYLRRRIARSLLAIGLAVCAAMLVTPFLPF